MKQNTYQVGSNWGWGGGVVTIVAAGAFCTVVNTRKTKTITSMQILHQLALKT